MGTVALAFVHASLALALGAPAWPLRADASGHHLEDRLGRPFLITSDSAWCLVNGLTDEELDAYLAARQAQGFNTVLFMLMSKHERCAVGGGSVDRYGQSPFVTGDEDWSVPNEAYWSRVDRILRKLEAHGMLAMVTPAYLGFLCFYGEQGWCEVMREQPVERMRDFGTFLGRRYRSQGNMIWVAGGDSSPLSYPDIDERVDALMSAIAAADTGHKLITGHADRHESAYEAFGMHPWLTLNTAYDGESCPDETMAAQIETEYARTPALPLLSIEQRFDQEGADEVCIADQYLWAALGGGVGHSYGNAYIWTFSPGWDTEAGIGSPLAREHANSAKLVRSRRYWLFSPDTAHTVVTAGYGSSTSTVGTSRASTGETVMAYVPQGGTRITVDMRKISGRRATAYWYDPFEGVATLVGSYPTKGALDFVSPADARVLVLDDASRKFPVPGSVDAPFRRTLRGAPFPLGDR